MPMATAQAAKIESAFPNHPAKPPYRGSCKPGFVFSDIRWKVITIGNSMGFR